VQHIEQKSVANSDINNPEEHRKESSFLLGLNGLRL
jgi:hypothetical protein